MTPIAAGRVAAPARHADETDAAGKRQALEWFFGGSILVFVVSFLGADVIGVHHDVYYLIWSSVVLTFLASFVAHTRFDWRTALRRNLPWSLALGVLLGFASVQNVLSEASTSHPTGAYYAFELAWRGLLYGAVDALILYVFPAAVAYLVLGHDRRGFSRKARFGALAFALSIGITATYHLGYADFRGADLVEPELGAVFGSVPAVLTGNPIGAVVLHDAFHVSANVHAYHSAAFLPPDLIGYPERGGGTAAFLIAAVWFIALGAVLWFQRNRLFPREKREST